MKNRQNGALGHPMANMATLWAQQCINIDVKTCTFPPPQANASWTLWSFSSRFTNATIVIHRQIDHDRQRHDQCIKKPHPEFPFAQVGDDTISALTQLAEIFKNKFQTVKAPELSNAPIKAAKNKRPDVMAQPILTSPMQHKFQTRSKTTIHTGGATNTPLLPRVITPMTGRAAPPRVPTLSQDLSTRNLSQNDFWNMETANIAVVLGKNHWSQQHFANAVVHQVTVKQMEYMALMKDPDLQPLWKRGFGNEVCRLFQGIRDIPGTDTFFFVELTNIPKDRKITYSKIICDYKPHKKEKERVRLTVGGDRLDYSGNVSTSTTGITTFKILINSTLSTKDKTMMMMDIKNYYLGTPLPRYEYMRMLLSRFLEEVVEKYNRKALPVDGWVYIEI
jgi:hypothetical protein